MPQATYSHFCRRLAPVVSEVFLLVLQVAFLLGLPWSQPCCLRSQVLCLQNTEHTTPGFTLLAIHLPLQRPPLYMVRTSHVISHVQPHSTIIWPSLYAEHIHFLPPMTHFSIASKPTIASKYDRNQQWVTTFHGCFLR